MPDGWPLKPLSVKLPGVMFKCAPKLKAGRTRRKLLGLGMGQEVLRNWEGISEPRLCAKYYTNWSSLDMAFRLSSLQGS